MLTRGLEFEWRENPTPEVGTRPQNLFVATYKNSLDISAKNATSQLLKYSWDGHLQYHWFSGSRIFVVKRNLLSHVESWDFKDLGEILRRDVTGYFLVG